jgi:hypothetical protein
LLQPELMQKQQLLSLQAIHMRCVQDALAVYLAAVTPHQDLDACLV